MGESAILSVKDMAMRTITYCVQVLSPVFSKLQALNYHPLENEFYQKTTLTIWVWTFYPKLPDQQCRLSPAKWGARKIVGTILEATALTYVHVRPPTAGFRRYTGIPRPAACVCSQAAPSCLVGHWDNTHERWHAAARSLILREARWCLFLHVAGEAGGKLRLISSWPHCNFW